MAAMAYRIELLDDESRTVQVQLDSITGALSDFRVWARRDGEIVSTVRWQFDPRVGVFWRDIGPPSEEERRRWWAFGIICLYCREFPGVLERRDQEMSIAASQHEFFKKLRFPPERDLDASKPLEELEMDLVWLLAEITTVRGAKDIRSVENRRHIQDWHDILATWEAFEPSLRRLPDDVREPLAEFYGELEWPRLSDIVRYLDIQPGTAHARLKRLTTLGNFALRAVHRGLGFAGGAHAGATAADKARWPMERVVSISRVELGSIRCFDAADVAFSSPAEDRGQWVVLLGENGKGKTTLLRALALALLDDSTARAQLKNFSKSGQPPLTRDGAKHARVAIEYNDQRAHVALGRESETSEDISPGANGGVVRPPVFGYGCRRGSAFAGPSGTADTNPENGTDTLFLESATVVHVEAWFNALNRSGDGVFFDAVKATLAAVLPGVERIAYEKEYTWAEGADIGRVRLSGLGDGYLTMTGWVVDFIARWAEYARRQGIELTGAFHERMSAVVLIDELDLHLHPKWQLEVVSTLRRTFPRTTFIATTHSPLVLAGLARDEIFILRGNERRTVDLEPATESPELLTSSELYEAFFDVVRRYPRAGGKELRRYAYLSQDPFRSDQEDEEMRALARRLAELGVEPEWEPVAREAVE